MQEEGILQMKSKSLLIAACGLLALSACAYSPPLGQAYWQRVEDHSALYMTGPKAQQQLDEDIATCVREVDELVELGALRKDMPPDTHSEYHRALDASGDMSWYDTPTRYGDKKISHKDFQDYEGCMRYKGWERVRFVRYQSAQKAKGTYRDTQNIRQWGGVPGGNYSSVDRPKQEMDETKDPFTSVNK
jgi:hypothetical protein